MNDVLTIVLAGGKGTRLDPLTRDRAKPAVPFGGLYRIIDFTLSNCINSNLRRILVLTQYKALSLDRHVVSAWHFLPHELDEYVEIVPPQQRIDETWYKGTADAIYQNIYSIERINPKYIVILAGDHVYKMDYSRMIKFHKQREADLTIGCVTVPIMEGRHFGIMHIDEQEQVLRFDEKPQHPPSLPNDPDHCLASMGIYVFNASQLYEWLLKDAQDQNSYHDFGRSIIPQLLGKQKVYAYRFQNREGKEESYWRDVGTIDAYYQANMDLVAVSPTLNLYEQDWPIHTLQPPLPPPKFVFDEAGPVGHARRGEAWNSMVCQGCIISGGHVSNSVLSPNVRVNSYATVERSILLDEVEIGRHCRVKNAIIDKKVKLPPGTTVGFDLADDRRRGFCVSEGGVVVITRDEVDLLQSGISHESNNHVGYYTS